MWPYMDIEIAMCVAKHTYTYWYVHTYNTGTYIHTYNVNTCIHSYVYTHIYIYIYIPVYVLHDPEHIIARERLFWITP